MIRRPPRSTRTDTLFPYTTLFRSRACRRVHLRFGQANRPYRAPKPHPTFSAPYLAERRSHASLPTLARDFRIGEQRRQAPSRAEEDAPVLSLGGTRRARRSARFHPRPSASLQINRKSVA